MTDDLKAWLTLYFPELSSGQITMLHNKIKELNDNNL